MASRTDASPAPRISVVLSDVDGTLVTTDKRLTSRTLDAVRRLRARGIGFTITSSRPPFGVRMLVEPLGLDLPLATFNGGVMLRPDLSILEAHHVPPAQVPPLIDALHAHGLDVFAHRVGDWFVERRSAPYVEREAATLARDPEVVPDLRTVEGIFKLVGVSDDEAAMAACEVALHAAVADAASVVRSQAYFLDVTHPCANKGAAIVRLAGDLGVPLAQFATLGDQPVDVGMFERSGVSIAMGNASKDVQRRATFVTTSNDEDGFANAVEHFILADDPATSSSTRP
ncbi:MAG: Cof-type HAD-IIB family hydrolase [Kofleriaceae bacterium]|nr:Cof-type HAD-IIB family hydrolase [Kofleriaceae bacterium]